MRRKLVAGNWKMNLTRAEASAVVQGLLKLVSYRPGVDVVLFPSYLSIEAATQSVKDTHISIGAQDVFWAESGAFTGQVSPKMLVDAGVTYCLIGHSETRGRFGKLEVPETSLGFFGETDATINLKLRALLRYAIRPVLCIGETLAEREAGQTDTVVANQVLAALKDIDSSELGDLAIAYEPVWAIGTGKTCDAAEANRVCGVVRRTVATAFGSDTAETVRVLYGGSVKASSATELFSQPEIDGGLVGGASLDPGEFANIILSTN